MTVLDVRPGIDGLDGPLTCTGVEQVTHDVTTFHLDTPGPLLFEPGQYVTVTVEVDGAPVSRCYSITSPPSALPGLSITVKHVPGGPVSGWLHDHLVPGGRVRVTGPLGAFGSSRTPGRPELFLTAGSGLTPLMCMARTLVSRRTPADVVLVHHARTPADVLFRHELDQLHVLHPGIRVVAVCEDAGDEQWDGRVGRISRDQLEHAVPDLGSRDVLMCGPEPYMRAARGVLAELGVDPARVHEESYDVGAPPVAVTPAQTGQASYAVEFRRSGRTVACSGATAVLAAAAEAGVTHPSSCGEGMCGTCKTTLLSGTVEMEHAGGIRPREVAAGKILLCCSTPTSDLVLDA